MRWALAVALAVTGCGATTAPLPDVRASGTWAIFLRLEGRERPSGGEWVTLRCEGGILTVLDDQDGTVNGGFTRGSLACWFGDERDPRAVDWSGPITGFHDLGAGVIRLDDGYCDYTGTVDSSRLMRGTVRCDRDSGSTELDLDGTWEATR